MSLDNCAMSEAAQEARREYKRVYMRKWRAANKERVAANNRNYWERKAEQEQRRQDADNREDCP